MKYYYLYIPALVFFLLPLLNGLRASVAARAAAREKEAKRAAAAAAKEAAEQEKKARQEARAAAADPAQEPKRKRGRPRKNQPAPQRPEIISPAPAPVVDPAPVVQAPAPALPPMISPETFAAKIS